MKSFKFFLAAAVIAVAVQSCDDEPEVEEEELITTVNVMLTPVGVGPMVTMSWQDLDGDGADVPIISGGTLAAATEYSVSVEFLNELESPAEDITAEVAEEDDEHQVFFSAGGLDLTFAYTDADGDGNPIGLASTWTTGNTGSGTVTVVLRHEPEKDASGVSDGDISNAGGSTDVDATYPVEIQ